MFVDLLSRPARLVRWLLLPALLLTAAGVHAALPIEHWTTSSGTRVYFVRADAIPMLDLNLDFDAGGRRDPAPQTGLASLTNAMLFKGAPGLSESQIAEGFAVTGALRGGGAGDDRASVSLRRQWPLPVPALNPAQSPGWSRVGPSSVCRVGEPSRM